MRTSNRLPLPFLSALLVAACGGGSAGTPASVPAPATALPEVATVPAATPAAPTLRLPAGARPMRYSVALTLTPTEDTFSGTVDIELELAAATSFLWLNGIDLTVSEATITSGGQPAPARAVAGGENFLGFAFEQAVGPGAATLHVS